MLIYRLVDVDEVVNKTEVQGYTQLGCCMYSRYDERDSLKCPLEPKLLHF